MSGIIYCPKISLCYADAIRWQHLTFAWGTNALPMLLLAGGGGEYEITNSIRIPKTIQNLEIP